MTDLKEDIRQQLLAAGAIAVGFSEAGEVDAEVCKDYEKWIGEGCHGEMDYLVRHIPLREHTDNVLKGAQTVISMAFSFYPGEWRDNKLPYISAYSYGKDYHHVIRKLLKPSIKNFEKNYGGKWRLCIDSAPVSERYWALKSGIGRKGLNGSVIVKGAGGFCFLAELLTTLKFSPDSASSDKCLGCLKCIEICPSGALNGDGTIDSRKCINFITIEKKGELNEEEADIIKADSGYLFGCDKCLKVCPHNKFPDEEKKGFNLFSFDNKIKYLTPQELLNMNEKEFKEFFKNSPMLYTGFDKLYRNSLIISKSQEGLS